MKYKLKECREKAGYSQLEVALELNSAQQQISKWEREIQDITLGKAIKLAELYNVSLDELAGRNGTMEQK